MQCIVADCGFKRKTFDCQKRILCKRCARNGAKMLQYQVLDCHSNSFLQHNDKKEYKTAPNVKNETKVCTAVERFIKSSETDPISWKSNKNDGVK